MTLARADEIAARLRQEDARLRRRTLWFSILPVAVGAVVLGIAWSGVQTARSAKVKLDKQIAAGKFESRSLDGRSEMRTMFEAGVLENLISSDLEAAGRRLLALPEDQRREVLEQLSFSELGPDARRDYATLVRQLVPSDERPGSFANIATQLVEDGGYQKVSAFLDAVEATAEERAVSARQAAATQLELLGEEGSEVGCLALPGVGETTEFELGHGRCHRSGRFSVDTSARSAHDTRHSRSALSGSHEVRRFSH